MYFVNVSPTGIPTDYNLSVFHKELKKIYGIVPLSPMDSPTAINLSVFHRELQNIYGIVPQSPTNLRTSRSARMSDTCPSAQIPMDRKVWRDFRTFLVRISINF